LSKLVKGYCVRLESERYVYHVPASRRSAEDAKDAALEEAQALSAAHEAQAQKARELMMRAEQFSADVRERALREAERLREQARQEGYQKGLEQGRFQALAENEKVLEDLKALMASLDEGRTAQIEAYKQQMIDLALDIARKVVGAKLEQDDEVFVNIFKRAVEGLSGQKIVKISVSGHEAEFVTAHADYLLKMVQDAEKLEVQVLEDAAPGTLIVDTEDVVIDASAQKQLEVLCQAVEDARYVSNN